MSHNYSISEEQTYMFGGFTGGLYCLVHRPGDISKLSNGYSIAVQIQISLMKDMVGLHYMRRLGGTTSRSHKHSSSTMRTPISKIVIAKFHYIWDQDVGR